MHFAGGDGADFSPHKSQRESDVQQPSRSGLPQGVKAGFSLAMFHVRSKHQRHVEKDLLDFGLADLVLVVTFTGIACIPIEPFDLLEIDHECIFS